MTEPCPSCGLRVILRADGSCPSCNHGAVAKDGEEPPVESVLSTVTLVPKTPLYSGEILRGKPMPREPDARIPKSCPCCSAKLGLVDLEVRCGGSAIVEVSACAECRPHLRPRGARVLYVPTFGLALVAGIFGKAEWLGWIRWVLILASLTMITITIVVEWRERRRSVLWPEPKGRHFGPIEIHPLAGTWQFRTRNRTWLRMLERGNPGFDITTRLD